MVRIAWALLAVLLLVVAGAAQTGEAALEGSWKATLLEQDGQPTLWIVRFDNKGGKWTGSVVATAEGAPATTLSDLSVSGERLRFNLKMGGDALGFEGKLPAQGAKTIRGSLAKDRQMSICELEATALTSLDSYELNREMLAKQPNDPKVFSAAMQLLSGAEEKKVKPEDVRGWAEKAWKAAEPYGVRWQREMATRIAGVLGDQEGFAPIAVNYAQRAERLLEPKDDPASHLRVLTVLSAVLKKAGKADEAKELQGRIARIEKERRAEQDRNEVKADEEYLKKMPPFKPVPFAGRKGQSERAVLVELFTGAQCPPCVAADLAFDGLLKTFKPTDVVLLQYHLHVPGPDALTTPASQARQEFYGDQVEGTPTILFNGRAEPIDGGSAEDAKDRYNLYLKVLTPLLEKPARAKLSARAVQKGDKIDISAEVAGLENPGETMRLRFALVEERIRYVGRNGLRFHHQVVRAMPGGEKGFALKDKTVKQSVSVNLDEVRANLEKYLSTVANAVAKQGGRFQIPPQALDFKNLRLVAFVQKDDKTKEVVQAVQVEIQTEKP